MSVTYVALFRGINVGGKNKLPMADLVEMFAEAGCGNVRTYIQSGNVIFNATGAVSARLPGLIATRISKRFGYKIPLVLRTAEQMGDVISNNPFLNAGVAEEELHVLFLADSPASRRVEDLDPDRSPPDAFKVRGQEIYLRLPDGVARTKLTNQYFDSKLRTTSTGRNWRTVTKLFELMEGQGSPNSATEARKHRNER
jgi:uncharacterized protein (DUF1697 family)